MLDSNERWVKIMSEIDSGVRTGLVMYSVKDEANPSFASWVIGESGRCSPGQILVVVESDDEAASYAADMQHRGLIANCYVPDRMPEPMSNLILGGFVMNKFHVLVISKDEMLRLPGFPRISNLHLYIRVDDETNRSVLTYVDVMTRISVGKGDPSVMFFLTGE